MTWSIFNVKGEWRANMKSGDRIHTLEARIRILVDKITEQGASFDKMHNKMFAIVGLLLTLGGLLTYDVFSINFPDNILEFIVFITALVLLGCTAALISYDYRAKKSWSVPIGPVEELKLDNAKDYEEALDIIHNDYIEVYESRGRSLNRKAKVLNGSLYMFIISVILLIVLKIGG